MKSSLLVAQHNLYLQLFADILPSRDDNRNANGLFPNANHIQTDPNAPLVNPREIIVPNYDFPDEVNNEDSIMPD